MIRTIKTNKEYGTKEITYKFPDNKKHINLNITKEELLVMSRFLKQVYEKVDMALSVNKSDNSPFIKEYFNIDLLATPRDIYLLDSILEELDFKYKLK